MKNTTQGITDEINETIRRSNVREIQSRPLQDEAKQRLFLKLASFHSRIGEAISLVK